jgi:hypothetical protein
VDFGTLVFNDDGTFTYTPDAGNTTGADSFTYTVSDEYGGTSNTATVAITLTNSDPVAQDDAYSNSHNLELDVTGDPIADVITGAVPELNGDYDPDNEADGKVFDDTLTAALVDDVVMWILVRWSSMTTVLSLIRRMRVIPPGPTASPIPSPMSMAEHQALLRWRLH